MEPKEILSLFVSWDPDESRLHCKKPFSYHEFTYATDGAACVRLPGAHADKLDFDCVLTLPWAGLKQVTDWICLDPIVPDMETKLSRWECKACSPDGTAGKKDCPECGGRGELIVNNNWSSYVVECNTCGGNGFVPDAEDFFNRSTCPYCYGRGYRFGNGVKVRDLPIQPLYLKSLLSLPDMRLCEFQAEEMFGFVFDGGEGFVMAMMA